jgi:photosystem II stability/assembly factor-like uncharacterized protein
MSMKQVFHMCAWALGWLFVSSLIPPSHAQWVRQTNGLPDFNEAGPVDACDDSTAVIVVGGDGGFDGYLTTNGGVQWRKIPKLPSDDRFGSDISIIDSLHIWCLTWQKIYRTTDGGVHWELQFFDTTKTKFINYLEMFDAGNGVAMADGPGNGAAVILQTSDGGRHWISMNDSSFGGVSYNEWREVDFIRDGSGFFSPSKSGIGYYGLWKTMDFGKTWIRTAYSPNSAPVVLKFFDENIGFVSSYGEGLARTTDGGGTWDYNGSMFTRWDIEFLRDNPSCVWILGDDNLFFSADNGNTWNSADVDGFGMIKSQNEGRDMVMTSRTHGWLLSQKAVYHTVNNGGLSYSVGENPSAMPVSMILRPNFPNPFNACTEIRYHLPERCRAVLRIFDLLGREIATLSDAEQDSGWHQAAWDGNDQNGTTLPSGVYIYRLRTGTTSLHGKMILVR